jgi:hypothetical protein
MEVCELIRYLEEKIGGIFTYEVIHNKINYSLGIKLFHDGVDIGEFHHPKELYQDICFMFGSYSDNELYLNVIQPLNIILPTDYSVHDLAINEIKELFLFQINQKK